MSHTFTFTINGDQRTCLAWQSQLNDFMASSGLQLPPAATLQIEKRGGAAIDGGGPFQSRGAPQAPRTRDVAPPPVYSAPRSPPQMGSSRRDFPQSQPSVKTSVRPGEGISPKVNQLLEQVRREVRRHGATEIAGIGRKFRICDDDNSGHIDSQEFAKAMRELGFDFKPDELVMVFNAFDDNGDGKVNYEEFLQAVRPPMSLRRKRLVQKVFEMLDTDRSGMLTPEDLKHRFNPAGDPRVQQREMTSQQVAAQFLSTFDVFDQDGMVGPEEFLKYYQGVSASIDNDDYFELMIRNAWHMSGGTGWSQCTSCTHVLVEHADGSETVEELKNDLGLDKFNQNDVMKRLLQQGITDAVAYKISS